MIKFKQYFEDYESFKEFFGINDAGKRKNAIVLAFVKWAHKNEFKFETRVNLSDIYDWCLDYVKRNSRGNYIFKLAEDDYHQDYNDVKVFVRNETIESDTYNGITKTNDPSLLRYVRHLTYNQIMRTPDRLDHPKTVHKKSGSVLKELITPTLDGVNMPASVINYVCEHFAEMWKAERKKYADSLTLHIDKCFSRIYDTDYHAGNFGSCMNNQNQYEFYEDSVKAHSAYLTNEDGMIVARCIIFDEVFDSAGNVYRYAERQYSIDKNYGLKAILVSKLIAGGHIDLYKEVGANYYDRRRIRRASDDVLMDKELFHIKCNLSYGDTISYQDTFAAFYMDEQKAYCSNPDDDCDAIRLNVCDSRLESECFEYYSWNYDSYDREEAEESWVRDNCYYCSYEDAWYDRAVYYAGNYYPYDSEYVVEVNGSYYHEDSDEIVCDHYGDYILYSDAVYCETDEDYYHVDDEDIVCVDDLYYRTYDNDICYCEEDDEYYLTSDCELINDRWVRKEEACEIA